MSDTSTKEVSKQQVLADLRKLATTVSEVSPSGGPDTLEQIGLESRLSALGMDSIAAASFVVEVEAFYGISLPPLLLFQCETVGDLVDQIASLIESRPG